MRFFSRFTPLDKSIPRGKLHYLTGFIITLLNLYQRYISKNFPSSCRFYPSCSEYAKQAVLKYGLSRGIIFALIRLTRCHPFSNRQGFDPVR